MQDTTTATTPAPGKFHRQGIRIIIYLLQMCDSWMASWPRGRLMLTMRAGTNNRTAVYENITNESDGEGLVEVCWTCHAAPLCSSCSCFQLCSPLALERSDTEVWHWGWTVSVSLVSGSCRLTSEWSFEVIASIYRGWENRLCSVELLGVQWAPSTHGLGVLALQWETMTAIR